MATTRLEFCHGASQKFWEITVKGSDHQVRYGRIGSPGRSERKSFSSPHEARAAAEKRLRAKLQKGYVQVGSSREPTDVAQLVVELLEAMVARSFDEEDPEEREALRPHPRPPASSAQIAALEKAWGRTLPPSYRAFVEVANGIENFHGTHLLLGTEDHLQGWAGDQVEEIAEFWDDYDGDEFIPILVPSAGIGIRNLRAFERGDTVEMAVVDWDDGEAAERFSSFEVFLRDAVELEHDLKTNDEEAEDELPAVPGAVVEAHDARRQFLADLDQDLLHDAQKGVERAEQIFHTAPPTDDLLPLWLLVANRAIHVAFARKEFERAGRWAEVARPWVRDNALLGHNLACAFVAVGRLEDGLEMCRAAVEAGYTELSAMRQDTDLGPLLEDPRFQELLPAAATATAAARTSIPRSDEHEMEFIRRDDPTGYGLWLRDKSPELAALIAADLAAEKEPKKQRKAKNAAAKLFQDYRRSVLAPAYPTLSAHLQHFLEKSAYLEFRYGLLDSLDTFQLDQPEERAEALALLSDPHGTFVRRVTPRNVRFDELDLFAMLPRLRQLQFRWTDIRSVESIEPLSDLEFLTALDISKSAVSDLRPLSGVTLVQLYCSDTSVVDLAPLAGHPTLSDLSLQNTAVTDITPLLSCPRLCSVNLWGTSVPKFQLEALAACIEKRANEPVTGPSLISGYRRYVAHPNL